jgi:glutathione S-transferase
MLELYHAHHSTCSQKVRLCMAEKGLTFKGHLINLATKEQLDPEYLKINPNGVVPSLVHEGLVVIDSSVICEYLDEVFPETSLTPENPYERARMRKWMRYIEEVPTAAVRFPSFNMAFLPRFDGLDEDSFVAEQADVRPLRKGFSGAWDRPGFRIPISRNPSTRSPGPPHAWTKRWPTVPGCSARCTPWPTLSWPR